MRISVSRDRLHPPRAAQGSPRPAVVSIGVFDGVHIGHRAILAANVARASALGAVPTVVTFHQHPKRVLLGRAPRTLTTLEHRLELFERAGIEHAVALRFDERLRELEAEEFVRSILVEGLGARAFVLGPDSKFGRARRGGPEFLRRLGFEVEVVPHVAVAGRPVSSTAIREAVELGDLEAAAAMLGRRVGIVGRVVRGAARGRELGFPTANLDLRHELHPPVGVYAGWARLLGLGSRPRVPAVANIGFRPTIPAADREQPASPLVEVHLIDGLPAAARGSALTEAEIYGALLEFEFHSRLRPERRFPDLAALREQIAADVARARQLTAGA